MRRVSALSSRLSTAVRTKKRIAACRTVPERRGRFSPRRTARLSSQSPRTTSSSGRSGLAAVTVIASKGTRNSIAVKAAIVHGSTRVVRGQRSVAGPGAAIAGYLYSRAGARNGSPW